MPREDKLGAERVVSHCAGWPWDTKDDGEAKEEIVGKDWTRREGLPAAGSLKNILVVRPAILTDGECTAEAGGTDKADKPTYRVSEGEITGYTISRKDVAHFVVDAVTKRWDEYHNKRITIVY